MSTPHHPPCPAIDTDEALFQQLKPRPDWAKGLFLVFGGAPISPFVFLGFFVVAFSPPVRAVVGFVGFALLLAAVGTSATSDTSLYALFGLLFIFSVAMLNLEVWRHLLHRQRLANGVAVLPRPYAEIPAVEYAKWVLLGLMVYAGLALAVPPWAAGDWFLIGVLIAGALYFGLQTHVISLGARVLRLNEDQYDWYCASEVERQGPRILHAQQLAQPMGPAEDGSPRVQVLLPRFTFADVAGSQPMKNRLLEAGQGVFGPKKPRQESKSPTDRTPKPKSPASGLRLDPLSPTDPAAPQPQKPRNGILLFGDPGNGKTFVAEALAGELGVRFVPLDYGKVVSKWIGETPQRITQAFADARAAAPCVLFIDEIDSFIINRDSGTHSNNESTSIVNLLLTELVNIREHAVLVVAATNRLDSLDPAAIREGRFDFKIEVPNPDAPARLAILTQSLHSALEHVKVEGIDMEAVQSAAERWDGFSVKRIQSVGEEMPSYLREHPAPTVGYDQLMGALRRLQGRKGKLPADAKGLGDLVLPEPTRLALDSIAKRMGDPLRLERLGGSLPGGVLFHGPAGTGKTAVARALAKDTGWAFISVAGPDLMAKIDKIDEVVEQARDLRPVIVFIDEADDVLRDRQYSHSTALTNKLLTVLDGAGGKVKDVLFIAATNNPDQIDPAMVRAGRFTEKVPFLAADGETAVALVAKWVHTKGATLASATTPARIGRLLEGQSPANIEGVMQYALNLAIEAASHGAKADEVHITLDQVTRAMDVVVPE